MSMPQHVTAGACGGTPATRCAPAKKPRDTLVLLTFSVSAVLDGQQSGNAQCELYVTAGVRHYPVFFESCRRSRRQQRLQAVIRHTHGAEADAKCDLRFVIAVKIRSTSYEQVQ